MIVYQRHINHKLLILWIIFVLLLLTFAFSIAAEKLNLSYFTGVLLLVLSLINITGLTIYNNSFIIHKYYLFGFIRKSWTIDKRHLYKAGLFKDEEIPDMPNADTWLDFLGIVLLIPLTHRVQQVIIKDFPHNSLIKKLEIGLTNKEYNLIAELLK
jgi:hypothetical protein